MNPPRLVLLPGLDGTGTLFGPFLKVWNGPAPVVIGYPRDRFLDHAQCADFVAERLPRDEPIALVGESFSGPVSILLAARLPKRVVALILCASFASAPRGRMLSALLRAVAPIGFRLPAPRIAIRELLLNGHRDADLLDLVCTNRLTVHPSVLARRFQAVMRCDVRDALRTTRQPLLYLQARRDRLVPRSAATLIGTIRRDLHVVTLDAPHFVMQTKPATCAEVIAQTLEQAASISRR